MRNSTVFILTLLSLISFSCKKETNKPEPETNIDNPIINPPHPTVNLSTHFTATINGVLYEWTENVNGYNGSSSQIKEILEPPELSKSQYFFKISSNTVMPFIEVGLGSVVWDKGASGNETRDLSLFNNFFIQNTNPAFSTSALNGFILHYRDSNNKIYSSREADINYQNVSFSDINQQTGEDPTEGSIGDYSKFKCEFTCYAYNTDQISMSTDSILIENAVLTGWFER